MSQTINHCPTCKGTGEQIIKSSTCSFVEGKGWVSIPEPDVAITCIDCHNIPMSEKEAKELTEQKEYEKTLFCKCSNEDQDRYGAYYVPDGVDPECSKHHYRCRNCRKIVQIG